MVRAFGFAGSILVARWLGVEDFGAFALIQSTLQMLTTFAMFGMGSTAARYIAALRTSEPNRVEGIISSTIAFSIYTGLIAGGILLFAAGYIASEVLEAPELTTPLRFVAPVAFISAVCGALAGCVRGFEAFKQLAHVNWLTGLISFLCVVGGVWLYGLIGAVMGMLLSETCRGLLTWNLARKVAKKHGFGMRFSRKIEEANILWKFSLPLVLGSALHAPVIWLCQTLIARQPEGLAELGVYGAAQKWMTLVMVVPLAASGAFGPILANLITENDKGHFNRTFRMLVLAQTVITLIPATIVGLASPWAVSIFGESFASGSGVIVTLMILAPVFVLKHLYWQAFTAAGRAWDTFWLAVVWSFFAIALTSYWQADGATGLAKAMLSAYGASLMASAVLMFLVQRSDQFRPAKSIS